MKNKRMTYVLGLAVAIVWGLIIYRIFDAAGGDDDSAPVASTNIKKEPYNDFNIPKDTTHLLLNYRDPFGLVKQRDTVPIIIKKGTIINTGLKLMQPEFNWNFIQYSGYIRNPGTKKFITMVRINGKNELLAEGETKNQVKLIKNLGDSIKIGYNGKIKFITIKTAL